MRHRNLFRSTLGGSPYLSHRWSREVWGRKDKDYFCGAKKRLLDSGEMGVSYKSDLIRDGVRIVTRTVGPDRLVVLGRVWVSF